MHFRRISLEFLQLISILILGGVSSLYWDLGQSSALELTNRSVTISSATPSAVVTDTVQATLGSVTPVGSIEFQYCSNSPVIDVPCIAPAGLSLSGAALSNQTGNTGFTIDAADSTANAIIITRTATPALATASSYTFSNVINPSSAPQTTFIRITTYSSVDATGAYIDNGSVAFSTEPNFIVGAYVPPFLNLCAGITVALDCSQTNGTSVDMGTLSPQTTGTATSQFSGSTNDPNGYTVYVIGTTMTSGNNVISAMNSAAASQKGIDQFGINLRQNTNPAIGSEPFGTGTAIPASAYDSPNQFIFNSGDEIANSTLSTNFNRMTVSYITNVASGQAPGIYNTTMTYLASAQF